ncbi:MAG: ABC transporter permease [Ignavibacteriaceae bacterium]
MIKRIIAIAKKEVRQLKRDKKMLYVLFVFPLVLLVLFGYAINFDVHNIQMAVYDQDRSEYSRDFIHRLTSSDYFDLVGYANSDEEVHKVLDRGNAQVVFVFPADLSRNLYSNKEAKIQILVEGVNASTASVIANYTNIATAAFSQKIRTEALSVRGRKAFVPISLEPRFWFNPDLNSSHFLVPGLISMILIITAVVSISLSVVREKERGTVEQLNVSPLSSLELLVGKTIPYIFIALFIASAILIAGYILFGTPVKGNLFLLLISTLIFLFASLNLGILVSSISDTQQVAFQIATMISFLPSFLLSGFVYPIESMPVAVQVFTNITPAKFYLVILRSILLKGAGIEAYWEQLVYLIIFSIVFLIPAVLINRKNKIA